MRADLIRSSFHPVVGAYDLADGWVPSSSFQYRPCALRSLPSGYATHNRKGELKTEPGAPLLRVK